MSRAPHGLSVRPWVLSLVAIVVCALWAANLVVGWLGGQADPGVNAIMGAFLALVGTIAGKSLLSRPSDDEDTGDGEDEPAPRPRSGRHRAPRPAPRMLPEREGASDER